jgi:hypothetical protein
VIDAIARTSVPGCASPVMNIMPQTLITNNHLFVTMVRLVEIAG